MSFSHVHVFYVATVPLFINPSWADSHISIAPFLPQLVCTCPRLLACSHCVCRSYLSFPFILLISVMWVVRFCSCSLLVVF